MNTGSVRSDEHERIRTQERLLEAQLKCREKRRWLARENGDKKNFALAIGSHAKLKR